MTPATGTALLILAVFVLPGFVTLLLRERMFAVRGEDTQFERLLNALYYSAVIYAIVFAVGALAGVDKKDVSSSTGEKSRWQKTWRLGESSRSLYLQPSPRSGCGGAALARYDRAC